MRRRLTFAITAVLLTAASAASAHAYAGAEQGTKTCNTDSPVATKIYADGEHSHTQRNTTKKYADAGYVRTTYLGLGYPSASYYITGGKGYFGYDKSSAYCAR